MAKKDEIRTYYIEFIPYEGWGVWKDEYNYWPDQLEKFLKRQYKILKVIKRRKKPVIIP